MALMASMDKYKAKISPDQVNIGTAQAFIRSTVWKVDSPTKYSLSILASETVNQDGIYCQNNCCHSFSGDANQYG